LVRSNGHFLKVEKISGRTVEDFGPIKNTGAKMPGVTNRQVIRKTTSLSTNGTGSPSPAPTNPNWVTFGYFDYPPGGSPISNFTTSWKVPNPPYRNDGQTIFILMV